MKIGKPLTRFVIALFLVPAAQAQMFFEDLDFESANLYNPSGPLNMVPIGDALPGWNASINGIPVSEVWANDYSTGAAAIDVLGPGWNSVGPGIIDGYFTVFLQAFNPGQGNVTLSQFGTIPVNTASLQFRAWQSPSANEAFTVTFDGNSLSPVALSSGQSPSGQPYTLYGVNMAPYARQTGQLEFTAFGGNGPDWIELDDISFSKITVTPEPSTLALILTGGAMFGLRCWRGKRT